MPEVIDILLPANNECAQFIVDTTALFVATAMPVPQPNYLHNSNGNTIFAQGDNFYIASVGVVLPESFTLWKDAVALNEVAISLAVIPRGVVSGNDYTLKNIGTAQRIYVPMENYEFACGVFVNTVANLAGAVPLSSEAFRLRMVTYNFRISMQNIPGTLHGLTFMVTPFIKVVHNFPLS